MPKFYKNVTQVGNYIYHRYVDDDGRTQEEYTDLVDIELFTQARSVADCTTDHRSFYDNRPLVRHHFGTIRDAKRFIDDHRELSNMPIHGNRNWWAQFIADQYPGKISWDIKDIIVANIDIETSMTFDDGRTGFPDPEHAPAPVTAITVEYDGEYHVFACKEYTGKHIDDPKVIYYHCKTEEDLLNTFLDFWQLLQPDHMTGWNIEGFDVPYLINRITKILGVDQTGRLSPAWRFLKKKGVNVWEKNRDGKKFTEYSIRGLAISDLLSLYKNYTFKTQEKYSLDHISKVELGEEKLKYEGTLDDLYRDDFNTFIDYNIHDVHLVRRLDDKLKLLALALSVTYLAKLRHDDHFFQVRTWDAMIFNELRDHNIVVPPMKDSDKDEKYTGAIVFDPQIGLHKWIVSADLNSLYPSLIRQYNISPEMLITKKEIEWWMIKLEQKGDIKKKDACRVLLENWHPTREKVMVLLKELIHHKDMKILDAAKELNLSVAANGVLYSNKRQGALGKLMAEIYEQRSEMKRNMLDAEKDFERTKDPKYKEQAAMFKVMQMSYKVMLNSCYGALGNAHFRYFNVDMAESITISGQLSIQWIQRRINAYLNKLLKTEDDYIVAGDTDSFYMKLGPFVDKVTKGKYIPAEKIVNMVDSFFEERVQPEIDAAYSDLRDYMNAYEQQMIMKREVIAEAGMWRAKKNYALAVWDSEGVRYDKPKIKITGMEAVKSNTPEPCRKALKDSIGIILLGGEKALQEYVSKFKKSFSELGITAVASPSGISDINKYEWADEQGFAKGTPYHVKGAISYNRLIKKLELTNKYRLIGNGEKIKYFPLRVPNKTFGNVIAWIDDLPDEFDLDSLLNYDLQYEKSFLAPLESITSKIGWQAVKKSTLF